MNKKKVIFDLVHGYLEIDCYTEEIINSESFQRLKFINQLTVQHLYPSANHTRFEHSLGVMKLSIDFINKLEDQFLELLTCGDKTDRLSFLRYHLIYSALLHDIGHAPLSHVGESLYNKDEIIQCIKSKIDILEIDVSFDSYQNGSPHEIMSCYVILEKFYNKLYHIYPNFDFDFIFRIITGSKYKGLENWDRNIIISIVNSDTIDIDKLDYLMRDNLMTGFVGPQIDVNRLMESLIIIPNKKRLSFKPVGLSAIQKVIDCRDSLYMWVYNHHTTVYTDYLYKECIKHLYTLKERGLTKFEEYIDHKDLFSCDAIVNRCVTDSEAMYYIRRAMKFSKDGRSSTYTKILTSQLLDRNFLKPSWKTLFEFSEFINREFKDDSERKEILDLIISQDTHYIKKIVLKLIEVTGCKLGKIFLVVRPNKFYCTNISNFYIYLNGKNRFLSTLLPQRNYSNLYEDIAFYLFAPSDKIELVKSCFVDIMHDYKTIIDYV
ncbi:MAG: dGTP triphosphohydrolase [Bacillota bacterium]